MTSDLRVNAAVQAYTQDRKMREARKEGTEGVFLCKRDIGTVCTITELFQATALPRTGEAAVLLVKMEAVAQRLRPHFQPRPGPYISFFGSHKSLIKASLRQPSGPDG